VRAHGTKPGEISVTPEADPADRRAIVEALARVRTDAVDSGRTAWWREGVRENLETEAEPDPD
jgi:hypothetical protein